VVAEMAGVRPIENIDFSSHFPTTLTDAEFTLIVCMVLRDSFAGMPVYWAGMGFLTKDECRCYSRIAEGYRSWKRHFFHDKVTCANPECGVELLDTAKNMEKRVRITCPSCGYATRFDADPINISVCGTHTLCCVKEFEKGAVLPTSVAVY
jgi:hypothetical protein